MKRDMDFARDILLMVEASDGPVSADDAAVGGRSPGEAAYHFQLLAAHGLLDVEETRAYGGKVVRCRALGLTWDGFDYLDAVRSQRVWDRAKAAIAETAGSVTVSVLKEVCSKTALAMVSAVL